MTWSSGPHPTAAAKIVLLLCFVWPFVAAALFARRGKSAAPVAAVIAPLALACLGAWLGLKLVMEGFTVSGNGMRAAVAAGIAESLTLIVVSGWFAAGVILAAALRLHRPIVDRVTAILTAVLIADAICVLVAGAMLRTVSTAIPIAGAVASGIIAISAMVWTFLAGRGRVASVALPYGVTVTAILLIAAGLVVWKLAGACAAIAIGR